MAAKILRKRKEKKQENRKVYFSERFYANMRESIDVMLLSFSSHQQYVYAAHTHTCPHQSITCLALHSSQAKRDFPLENVISLHENHHRQPGRISRIKKKKEKCIPMKSTPSADASKNSLRQLANSISDLLNGNVCNMHALENARKKLRANCLATASSFNRMKSSRTSQRLEMNEKQ